MNTPNKLTIIRMVIVPFFLLAFCLNFAHSMLVALILFIAASLTDFFDGMLARKYSLVTNFGKFLDPLADKMLTTSALLGFMILDSSVLPGAMWITFITLFREFVVFGIRLAAVSDGGKVVAANNWGKAKTVSQMIGIIFVISVQWWHIDLGLSGSIYEVLRLFGALLMWVSAILTIISGVIYVVDNAKFIDPKK